MYAVVINRQNGQKN